MKQGYPRADTHAQDFSSRWPGASMVPNVLLLHDTEGMTWPDYDGGSKAPHYTARPMFAKKRMAFRQHFDEHESSRALQNLDGGVETNTLNVVQIELVGTCSPGVRAEWLHAGYDQNQDFIYWPDPPDWALADIADFTADLHRRLGIPFTMAWPLPWPAYPASASAVRMSNREWINFRGICGHMHVPENTHGDPGAFPVERMVAMAKDIYNGGKVTKWARARADLLDIIPQLREAADAIDSVSPMRKRVHALGDEIDQMVTALRDEIKSLPKA